MPYDETLADRIRKVVRRRKGFVEKKMFGGVGFLLNGNMCVGVWKNSLVVRFDREEHEATLAMERVRPFDITGRVMKGWALIDPEGIASDEMLKYWIELAIGYVRTLPEK